MKKVDFTGKRFGRLVALERLMIRKGISAYKCQCDCGNETIVTYSNLLGWIKRVYERNL